MMYVSIDGSRPITWTEFAAVNELTVAEAGEILAALESEGRYEGGGGALAEFTVERRITRYIVRDVATKGCDFLLWGDDDPEAAKWSLDEALAEGLEVELVVMLADEMDEHTRKLIEGE
jgi:hypothetical protein